MAALTYTRFELLRTFRNRRFLIFSVAFPLVMFLLIGGPQRDEKVGGIDALPYFMVGMISWGTMAAVIGCGARIAAERQVGWHRQLRITPLPLRTYFGTKVLGGYVMAILTIVVISLAGVGLGADLSPVEWLRMIGLILVGLIPFAVLGVMLGHVMTVDSMGPIMGGLTSLLAVLGGAFGPIASGGILLAIVKCLPSYWLVQAGPAALSGQGWPAQAWVVLVVWTAALTRLAIWVYRRDTARV